jgi:hypothetical protein
MPVYAATGKLGGGKTLWAVKKARDALLEGRIVASNIDLFPEQFLALWKDQDQCKLYRLPDTPLRQDLDNLGVGNASNDERKNGLVILDECGAMLNARSFQEKGRDEIISWFLHARKLGWDIIFVVQDLSIIDKQIRVSLIEYLVTCRRLDRYRVPLLSWVGINISMPRIHFAIVRYGVDRLSMVSHREFYRGTDLFQAYSTRQLLMQSKPVHQGISTVPSPWRAKGRFMTRSKLMVLSIRTSLIGGLAVGAFFCFLLMTLGFGYKKPLTTHSASAITDLTGTIFGEDGSLIVLDKSGRSHVATKHEFKNGQLFVTFSDGKIHTMEEKK